MICTRRGAPIPAGSTTSTSWAARRRPQMQRSCRPVSLISNLLALTTVWALVKTDILYPPFDPLRGARCRTHRAPQLRFACGRLRALGAAFDWRPRQASGEVGEGRVGYFE